MAGVYKVKESKRVVEFINGTMLYLSDVVEVDNRGTYLRITTTDEYYLINPAHVLYHRIEGTDKVF